MIFVVLLAVLGLGWVAWLALRNRPQGRSSPARLSRERNGVTSFEGVSLGPEWRKMNAFHQSIVGEQHYVAAHDSFLAGEHRRVMVDRELQNPHDPNALAVIGLWRSPAGEHREKLGYLPRAFAAEVAATRPADMPLSATPVSTYTSKRDGYRNMKIDLYEPSVRSGYWREAGIEPPQKIRAS